MGEIPDYTVPTINGTHSSITQPVIQANTFEIKWAIIQIIHTLLQFTEMLNGNLNVHVMKWSLRQCHHVKDFPVLIYG